ncbi:MAG: P44/Msp2 family outer membrane protein [Pseudomonadota bacterium]
MRKSFSKGALTISTALTTALTAGLATSPANAGDIFNFEPAPSRAYISVFGGGSFLNDSDFAGVSNPDAGVPGPTGVAGAPLDVALDYSTGFTVGGAVGKQLPFTYFGIFQPRLEIEVSYLENDIDAGSFNGGVQTFGGQQEAIFVYLNNYSDIRWSQNQAFVPYIGGGLGAAFIDSDVGYFPASASAPTFAVQGSDTAFAGHIAAGASYALGQNAELFTEGRYFRIRNAQFERNFVGGGNQIFVGDVDDDIAGFTVTGGLRWKF